MEAEKYNFRPQHTNLCGAWCGGLRRSAEACGALRTIAAHMSNGVRQGGVLSPILFSLYLDELLLRLSSSNVGCYWGHHFAGALAYADDVVLLAPCASALRIMLTICESFASSCGLCFNPLKTQLTCLTKALLLTSSWIGPPGRYFSHTFGKQVDL